MQQGRVCPNCGTLVETFRNPLPTVDVVVVRAGRVLLIERMNPPAGWALPGGFIDYGEAAETAAVRELAEETGLRADKIDLLGVYSDPERDPRHHTLSVVYMGTATGEPVAGDDAGAVKWFALDDLPQQVAFDHRRVIADARRWLERSGVSADPR
jgi:ADP-ribose pyrophosphatase YjhB (NUDIX family)